MERKPQPTATPLIQALVKKITLCKFHRFCQLLEKTSPWITKLGSSHDPNTDPIRFRPHRVRGFPATEPQRTDPLDKYRKAQYQAYILPFGALWSSSLLPTSYLDDIANTEMVRIHSTDFFLISLTIAWRLSFIGSGANILSRHLGRRIR